MAQLQALLAMVGGKRDSALLRLALATEYLKSDEVQQAEVHLRQALDWQPDYTAAWKLLGKTLAASGQTQAAIAAYQQGLTVAAAHGDLQAQKEMTVFLRRLTRPAP